MTAEVAIMNKLGIALAADSAATVSNGLSKEKVLNSAKKLFTLSKYHPVGIMIYSNASFMGIPWETLIKLYRKKLGSLELDTLRQYCDKFFSFLDSIDYSDYQDKYADDLLLHAFLILEKELQTRGGHKIQIEELSVEDILNIQSTIDSLEKKYTVNEGLTEDTLEKIKEFKKTYATIISKAIIDRGINISVDLENIITAFICKTAVLISLSGRTKTGIVFSGFGKNELFPSTIEFEAQPFLFKEIQYTELQTQVVSHDNDAVIMPFAQSNELRTFMTGIGRDIHSLIFNIAENGWKESLLESIEETLNTAHIDPLDQSSQDLIMQVFKALLEALFKQIKTDITDISLNNFTHPVVNTVNHLSIEDLAVMAETFVNLESFRKKVTMMSETVGGPIDVAVITKAEGLIWIKRKHYFDAELNSDYFKRN